MLKYWSRRLSRPVKLASGIELVTLRDAAEFVRDNLRGVVESSVLEHICELLLAAAECGRVEDCHRATEEVELLLKQRRWM